MFCESAVDLMESDATVSRKITTHMAASTMEAMLGSRRAPVLDLAASVGTTPCSELRGDSMAKSEDALRSTVLS